jgi:hypothetical protein
MVTLFGCDKLMKINRKRILKHLDERKGDRGPVTLYLSKSLFKRFKASCGGYSASEVMEEMMREFISSQER